MPTVAENLEIINNFKKFKIFTKNFLFFLKKLHPWAKPQEERNFTKILRKSITWIINILITGFITNVWIWVLFGKPFPYVVSIWIGLLYTTALGLFVWQVGYLGKKIWMCFKS